MYVRAESFCRGVLKLSDVAVDSSGQTHQVWAALTSLCAMRSINDPRYLPGDGESVETPRLKQKTATVEFSAPAVKSKENYIK